MKQEIRNEVEHGHLASAGVLRDFCDGEFVRNIPLVEENSETLLLALYFDDLEIANPLGSRRGKHKLGMVHEFNSAAYYSYNASSALPFCVLIFLPRNVLLDAS